MTKLDCNVSSCLYNKEKSCCKDNIEVVGDEARHSRDTCCSSFRRRSEQVKSGADYPSKNTRVSCQVKGCTFNKDCCCQAKHIGINGGEACDCKETECSAFRCKCE